MITWFEARQRPGARLGDIFRSRLYRPPGRCLAASPPRTPAGKTMVDAVVPLLVIRSVQSTSLLIHGADANSADARALPPDGGRGVGQLDASGGSRGLEVHDLNKVLQPCDSGPTSPALTVYADCPDPEGIGTRAVRLLVVYEQRALGLSR